MAKNTMNLQENLLRSSLLVNFKADTPNTVSRETLHKVASKLGLSDTATMHLAMAQLRDRVVAGQAPLSDKALTAIQAAGAESLRVMQTESTVVSSESLL